MTKDKDREISYLTLCVETLKAENETLRQGKDQIRLWNENELLRRKLAVAMGCVINYANSDDVGAYSRKALKEIEELGEK
jgi:hypothetical protein